MSQSNSGKTLGVAVSKPTLDGLTVGGTASGQVATVELGQSATDLVALHGATAIAQAATLATIASGTAATTATYGAPTPDIATLFAAVNAIQVVLHNKGITG
jgi:homogentisate 1,2-dioxygenase